MTPNKWFALRIYYGGINKVLRIQSLFDSEGIETFVPMQFSNKPNPKNPEEPLKVPALKELVMIRATEFQLSDVRGRHLSNRDLRYVDFYRHRHGECKGLPIEIPHRQMTEFMECVKKNEENISFYTEEKLRQKKGRAVEVVAGQFKGAKGILMRIENNRHVVIVLPDVMGASLPHIPVANLRFIE